MKKPGASCTWFSFAYN